MKIISKAFIEEKNKTKSFIKEVEVKSENKSNNEKNSFNRFDFSKEEKEISAC